MTPARNTIQFHLQRGQRAAISATSGGSQAQGPDHPQPPETAPSLPSFALRQMQNELAADSTPWTLANGRPVEILNFAKTASRVAPRLSPAFARQKVRRRPRVMPLRIVRTASSLLTTTGAVFNGDSDEAK